MHDLQGSCQAGAQDAPHVRGRVAEPWCVAEPGLGPHYLNQSNN